MIDAVFRVWKWWFAIPVSLRIAIGVWLTLLIGVFGRVAFSSTEQQSVVPIYLLAAERLKVHDSPYADPPRRMDVYRNPPAVAALFVPFTWVDPKLAAILWRVLGISLYMLGIRQLIRDVLPSLTDARRAWVWGLSALLVIPAFNNGQINLPIAAFAVLGTAAVGRNSQWLAAFCLVICGWFKIYTLSIALLMSVAKWRVLSLQTLAAVVLVIGGTWGAVELWAAPQSPLKGFIVATSHGADRRSGSMDRAQKDWTILVRVWAGEIVPTRLAEGVSLVVAMGMACVILLLRNSLPKSESILFPFALGMIWLTLFGPATEMNTYSVLAPVAAVLSLVGRAQGLARIATVLLAAAVIRGAFPNDSGAYPFHSLQPIGTMLLLVSAIQGAWRAREKSGADAQGNANGVMPEVSAGQK